MAPALPNFDILASEHCELPDPAQARFLREMAQVTQRELADAIGVNHSTVSLWESGKRRPRGPAARLYLLALERLTA